MPGARFRRYLSVIWLYSIGISVIILGLVKVYTNPGPYGVMVMLGGLSISGIGAARGRKIMITSFLETEPVTGDYMQKAAGAAGAGDDAPAGRGAGPEPGNGQPQLELDRLPPRPFQPVFIGIRRMVENMPRTEKPERPQALRPAERAMSEELTPATEEAHVAYREKIVKIIICPKCSTENSEIAKYCYNCGRKLRTKLVK
jgi:ribosomal protein L40E